MRVLTAQDGSLSSDVWSVLVDGERIRLGTDSGIVRYDGPWTHYPNLLGIDVTAMQYSA